MREAGERRGSTGLRPGPGVCVYAPLEEIVRVPDNLYDFVGQPDNHRATRDYEMPS
jgi:hypothetical protein